MTPYPFTLAITALLIASSAHAEVPRGDDVDEIASHCGIGPFPQTTKAAHYNTICH